MYIIFSDVDGTMIDNDLNLMKETISDIKLAQEKGVKLAICTGNSHLTNMYKLAKKVTADFLITSDGARIYDLNSKTIVFQKKIDKKNANDFFTKVLKKWSHYITWTTEKGLYLNAPNPEYKEKVIAVNKKYHCQEESFKFSNKIYENIYKMTCYAEKNNLDMIVQKAKLYKLNYLRHNDNFMSFSPQNYDKGAAIKKLCLLMKTSINDIMTIGDGINDMSMMKLTKNSYAMANAIREIKESSSHHTSSVDQNGLGEAITDFMFRKKI